jgi:hypothetical protein
MNWNFEENPDLQTIFVNLINSTCYGYINAREMGRGQWNVIKMAHMLYQTDCNFEHNSDLQWVFHQFPFIAIIYK